MNIITVLLIKKYHYKIRLRKTVLLPNTLTYLQITLAAEAHLAGQFLPDKRLLNTEVSNMQSRTSKTNSFQNGRTELDQRKFRDSSSYVDALFLMQVYFGSNF
jgi:hypothetical protein